MPVPSLENNTGIFCRCVICHQHYYHLSDFQVQKTLMNLVKTTSAEQQKWLIRILLKDLKLGLGQAVMLKAFHKDAEELFNVTTNLEEVSEVMFISGV